MRIRHTALCIVLLMASAPAMAQAETYQWTDAAGVRHFTDNPDTIPARYLNRVREVPASPADQHGSPPPSAPVSPAPPLQPQPAARSAARDEYDALGAALQRLQERLAARKKELEQLRRKWTVVKGRTPTSEELAEFEKKRAKGRVTASDNPYVNKSPLGAPGLAREAYYKKLDEIRSDEARIGEIRKMLDALSRKAGTEEAQMER